MPPPLSKSYYTIGEAAAYAKVEKYVLRFWETKFPQISPMKRTGGRRYYRPEDLEAILFIKSLLREKGLTIKGAQMLMKRKSVSALKRPEASDFGISAPEGAANPGISTEKTVAELKEIRAILSATRNPR